MFTLFSEYFSNVNGFFHLFSYITFRCGFSMVFAFLLMFICMPKYISFSHKWQSAGQPIREKYLPSHILKKGTPTAGGVMIILSTVLSTLLFSDLKNNYVVVMMISMVAFGVIGFIDDYRKVYKKNTDGICGKTKLFFQCIIAISVILYLNKYVSSTFYSKTLTFPFFRHFFLEIGVFYTLLRIFVIIGSSNAVNITDGLDGLAIVPVIITNAVFSIFAYITGNAIYSKYLLFNYQFGVQEICVFISATIGASIGFLWYNLKPAQIFMGDTGSLSLGGTIGVAAVILKCEFLLAIVGGLFVIETLSVILQVMSFKISHGKKRIFKMAPLHHHFEKSGWSETQVVVRFWIISLLFAFIGLASLKIR